MPRLAPIAIFLSTVGFASSQTAFPGRTPDSSDAANVLSGLSIASFAGASQDSIQAAAADSSGNILVAGTTYSATFPVKKAAQSVFGESRILATNDLGVTWTRVGSPPTNVSVVVPDPVVPQILFAAGAAGIYKSTDGGQTWQFKYAATNPSLVIDPGNHLRLATITSGTGAVIRSLDGGETWTPGATTCPSSFCIGQLIADPTGSGTLIANTSGLQISRDWGLTFQPLGPFVQGISDSVAFDPSHPGWIYASPAGGGLFLTIDYGSTWTQKASPSPGPSAILNLAVDADQPNTLVAATPSGLYKSTDGAASWALQTNPGSSFSPETYSPFVLVRHSCNPNGGLFAIDQSVAFSPDDGATWTVPQLTQVTSIAAGTGCTIYATRTSTTDAFVAKIAPGGEVLWAMFLGGSDSDTAVALAVDSQGNAYVAGNTSSPDFPSTVPRTGPHGQNAVFLTKFTADGRMVYSTTLGGSAKNTVVALAVDSDQNAYIAGTTQSTDFPATPGAFASQGSYKGFLAKFSSSASLVYATYLGATPGALLVDENQEPIIGGAGQPAGQPSPPYTNAEFILKLDRSASRALMFTYLPVVPGSRFVSGLATDPQGNLVVLGEAQLGTFIAENFATPQSAAHCNAPPDTNLQSGDGFLLKLAPSDWHVNYSAVFTAPCGVETGSISIDSTGEMALSMASAAGFGLSSPVLGGPVCGTNSSIVVKLNAAGNTAQFATYLNNCGLPAIAFTNNGALYAGVSPAQGSVATSVLNLGSLAPAKISLDRISNAFSADASAVVGGGLYSLAISGFQPPINNVPLNAPGDLPLESSGVQVKFGGVPASILRIDPNRIIVAAPSLVPVSSALTVVQVFYNGAASNAVMMPVSPSLPGLLMLEFPNVYYHADFGDGNIRNQDGTANSIANPAPVGSTITVFATGMGAAYPEVFPGSVATSLSPSPATPIYSTWQTARPGLVPAPLPSYSVPAFVSAMYQIWIPVPANLSGTDEGNGVQRVEVGLQLIVPLGAYNPPVSNLVGVYVK